MVAGDCLRQPDLNHILHVAIAGRSSCICLLLCAICLELNSANLTSTSTWIIPLVQLRLHNRLLIHWAAHFITVRILQWSHHHQPDNKSFRNVDPKIGSFIAFACSRRADNMQWQQVWLDLLLWLVCVWVWVRFDVGSSHRTITPTQTHTHIRTRV